MTESALSMDTLQGIIANDPDALSLIATIDGKDYEVGLMYYTGDHAKILEITEDGVMTAYAVRRVYIWRPVGSDSQSVPFPVIGVSSVKRHFIVLEDDACKRRKKPIAVEAVRRATNDEQLGDDFRLEEADLIQLLGS